MVRNALDGPPGWHWAERISRVREIRREYERSLSALKSGVNPGWSREADTTPGRTVEGGSSAASDKPAPLGGGAGLGKILGGIESTQAG